METTPASSGLLSNPVHSVEDRAELLELGLREMGILVASAALSQIYRNYLLHDVLLLHQENSALGGHDRPSGKVCFPTSHLPKSKRFLSAAPIASSSGAFAARLMSSTSMRA